ncbi:hypothetical protein SAMN04487891_102454 [Flagellimonas taeanensis]|uniref:Uncharacterized protein n=1 Tax=Flagellimonas taeanensis TaxID=1005926 RepID=A0A1M6SI07_9FLAO|nr:hypothetical protein [Allomuricauda taeanensis]SFB80836.1 hypothetical protein SAMN04487891_102454 [Allomuricauda taeanensis]SHK44188.1 hypothetical protein SAMN05216293_1134 [Allomuricauda taeanensis]
MEENKRTVAEVTIHYKKQRLMSLIFDTKETADAVVEILSGHLNEKGKREFSFSGEIKTIYSGDVIVDELNDWMEGKIEPKGTILDLMKILDGLN